MPGTAQFIDDKTVSVNGKRIQAQFFILATGAKPMELPIKGIEHLITSDDFLDLTELPPSILFIGGGFISFEFAHFAARLGAANQRSVILEAADGPLGTFDSEMVELLVAASEAECIDVRNSVEIEAIEKHAEVFSVRTANSGSFETNLVVHGAGRVPNLDTLQLDAAGVEATKRGITIKQAILNETPVDELYQQTIVSPYPTRKSDMSYMLKPLLSDK